MTIITQEQAEINENVTPAQPKRVRKPENKARYFTFLLYPESTPEDFVTKLESLSLPMAISPLHNQDVSEIDTDSGEVKYKKEHYHVIYAANNPVTPSSVRDRIKRTLGKESVAMVKICDSVPDLYQYLTHESKSAIKANKHVYNKEDIIHLNNFDIDRYTGQSKEEKDDVFELACDLIMENGLLNIVMLNEYVKNNPACGLTRQKINMLALSYSGALRLFFDGAYQEAKKKEER